MSFFICGLLVIHINNNTIEMKSIIGIGLVALDVVLEKNSEVKPILYAGGSCGNVLSILSYLGFSTYPIARLANNRATEELINDIKTWGVKTDLIIKGDDGSTPIIIQRISKSKDGTPIHRFEFRDPETGKYLPSFKPVLVKSIEDLYNRKSFCDFFYLDRISRSSIELAKLYKNNGAIIIFEPSSLKIDNTSLLNEIVEFVDIIKFSNDRIPHYKSIFENGKIPIEIETLGKEGINYRINTQLGDGKWKHVSTFDLLKIVDSAGAGDWTTAGIIKSLIENNITTVNQIDPNKFEDFLIYGQALGALSCLYKGARGLMYNVNKNELDYMSEELILNDFSKPFISKEICIENSSKNFDSISSLLLH